MVVKRFNRQTALAWRLQNCYHIYFHKQVEGVISIFLTLTWKHPSNTYQDIRSCCVVDRPWLNDHLPTRLKQSFRIHVTIDIVYSVSGTSGSGKTVWVKKLLDDFSDMVHRKLTRYCTVMGSMYVVQLRTETRHVVETSQVCNPFIVLLAPQGTVFLVFLVNICHNCLPARQHK